MRWWAVLLCVSGCGLGGDPGMDPPPPNYAPWTMVVLPDTQIYTSQYPEIWAAQSHWIAEHGSELGIRLVVQVGDVTDGNTPIEWQRAKAGFDEIEAVASLVVVPGNHDYDIGQQRVSGLTAYWPVAHVAGLPTFGGLYEPDRTDNHYQRFEIDGQSWLVLGLEWAPRPAVLDWAADVLDREPADHVIVATHAYLYSDNRRYDWRRWKEHQRWNPHAYASSIWPEVSDGEELWQRVITLHGHVDLVVSGHVAIDGVGRATSKAADGHRVHEVLQDYQGNAHGGDGDLRLFTFRGNQIEVRTYSPWLDRFRTDGSNDFALPWRP